MGDVTVMPSLRVSRASMDLPLAQLSLPAAAPAFTLPPRNCRVSAGSTARFDVKVNGRPDPQVTWYRNAQPVQSGDRCEVAQGIRGNFSLVIRNVTEGDSGKYTCEAVNDGGVRQVTVELTVEGSAAMKYSLPSSTRTLGGHSLVPPIEKRPSIWGESPPKFITKPGRTVVREGQSGRFSCKITGRPPPEVTWYKEEDEIQPGGRYSMSEKSGFHFLEIREVGVADAGTYTCAVSNRSGKTSVSAELLVQGSEKTDGRPGGRVIPTTRSPEPKPVATNGLNERGSGSSHGTKASHIEKPDVSPVGIPGTPSNKPVSISNTDPSPPSRAVPNSFSSDPPRGSSRISPSLPAPGTKQGKEPPPVTSRYTSTIQPKVRLPLSSKETPPTTKATAPFPDKETSSLSPVDSCPVSAKETSPVASRTSSNIDSKIQMFLSKDKTSAKEPPYLGVSVLDSKNKSVPPKGPGDIIQKEPLGRTPREPTQEFIRDSPSDGFTKETSSKKLPSVMNRETSFLSARERIMGPTIKSPYGSAKTLGNPASLYEMSKETRSDVPSRQISNVTLSESLKPKETAEFSSTQSFPKSRESQSRLHGTTSSTLLGSSTQQHPDTPQRTAETSPDGGEVKRQKTASSTITLKSVKIETQPKSEISHGGTRHNQQSLPLGREGSHSHPGLSDTKETLSRSLGTAPGFDLSPSSQEVPEGSEVIFRCKGICFTVKGKYSLY